MANDYDYDSRRRHRKQDEEEFVATTGYRRYRMIAMYGEQMYALRLIATIVSAMGDMSRHYYFIW